MTRSVSSFVQGRPGPAWEYNPFGPAAVVVFAWYALRPIVGVGRARRVERSRAMRVLGLTVLVLFVGHGVGRAVGVFPDHTAPASPVGP